MQRPDRLILFGMLLVLLAGCTKGAVAPSAGRPAMNSAASVAADAAPSADPIYYILAGEMALDRGEADRALHYYRQALRLTHDVHVAERAGRIALQAPDDPEASEVVQLWVHLAPHSLAANEAGAVLALHRGQAGPAVRYLQNLLTIAEKGRPEAGYLLVTALLSREKDQDLALSVMGHLVGSHPTEPAARLAYALLAHHFGREPLAARQAHEAIAMRGDWPGAWTIYLEAMTKSGKAERALAELKSAVAKHADNVRLRVVYARGLLETQHYAEAREQFSRVLRDSPRDVEVIYPLALLALNMHQDDLAKRYLLQLVRLDQHADEAMYYLGELAESAKHFKAARHWYGKVAGSEYGLQARIRLAVVVAKEGDIAGARRQLEQLRSQHRDDAVRLYLAEGEVLSVARRYKDMMALYSAALKQYPNNTDLLYSRALAAEKIDRIDLLERDLRHILAQEPNNATALNALGYTLADRTKRYKEAYGYIRHALQLDPNDPAIMDSMGWVLYRLGRDKEATGYLRRALALGNDPEIAAHLGEVLWVSGDHEEARKVWHRALSVDPKARSVLEAMKRLAQ